MEENNKRKLMGQVEEILKRKGVSPRALTSEQLMQKVAQRLDIALPRLMDRLMDVVVDEELARLGRSQVCRYWHKGCTKGIATCRLDCDAYQQRRWWQQRPQFTRSALEYLIIGICVGAGIAAFFYPEVLLPVLYLWLVTVIISRIQIIYLQKFSSHILRH